MSQISTKKGRRQYPVISPATSMPDMPEYGAKAQMFGAISGMAFGLADRLNQIDIDNQLSAFEGNITEQYNTLLGELASNPEPSTYLAEYDKYTKSTMNQANALKSSQAKRAAQNWFTRRSGYWQRQVQNMALGRAEQNSRAAISLAEIKAVEGRDPELINRPVTRGITNGTIPKEYGEEIILRTQKKIGIALMGDEALRISQSEGREKAIEWVMKQKIDIDAKKGIVSDLNFEAAQQKLAYDKQLEQIEANYLLKLRQEQLSEDDITTDLQVGKIDTDLAKEYYKLIDAQVEERLSGEVPLNVDAYDKLQTMVEDYDEDKIDKDTVRKALSEAAGKDISMTIYRSLRDRLAIKGKPDEPMNKASAKRAMSILTEMKTADMFWPEDMDDDDPEGKRQNLLRYLDLSKELEQWITANPEATDEQINDKVDTITQTIAERVALNWFERLMRPKETTPFWRHFGTTEEAALARKEAKAGIVKKESPYPEYPNAFEENGVWKVIRDGKKYRIE